MHCCYRTFRLLAVAVAALGFATAAHAQQATNAQPPAGAVPSPAPDAQPIAAPGASPIAGAGSPALVAGPGGMSAEGPTEPTTLSANPASAAKPKDSTAASYGLAFRWRYLMIPGWYLKVFTEKNVPLYTPGSFALEGFRRKLLSEDPVAGSRTLWELAFAVGYQDLSPPDGYWLGKGKDPVQDTDLVQVRGLSLITLDMTFVMRQYFTRYFGIHYGAGLGLGIVRGKVLRASATCDPDPVTGQCTKPYTVRNSAGQQICDAGGNCNEDPKRGATLSGTEGVPDKGPTDPHRFEETGVPPALPILNLLVGIDGRIPIPQTDQVIDIRLEGGLFDIFGFFVGFSAGYQM
jgi:hypothetical protein